MQNYLRRSMPSVQSVDAAASGLPVTPVVSIGGGTMRDLVQPGAGAFCGLLYGTAPTRLEW
jgi:hypothetical protein